MVRVDADRLEAIHKNLHFIHCAGCPEYGRHGGAWKPDEAGEPDRNEGFDSPPPPSTTQLTLWPDSVVREHEHGVGCYDC